MFQIITKKLHHFRKLHHMILKTASVKTIINGLIVLISLSKRSYFYTVLIFVAVFRIYKINRKNNNRIDNKKSMKYGKIQIMQR